MLTNTNIYCGMKGGFLPSELRSDEALNFARYQIKLYREILMIKETYRNSYKKDNFIEHFLIY